MNAVSGETGSTRFRDLGTRGHVGIRASAGGDRIHLDHLSNIGPTASRRRSWNASRPVASLVLS